MEISNINQSVSVKTELEKNLIISQAIQILKDDRAELIQQNQLLTSANNHLKSNIKRLVHDCNKLYTTSEISTELQFRSAQELNSILKEKGIQYKVNGTWKLTSKYMGNGYTETKQEEKNGIIIYDTKWTGRGREFLINMFGVEII